ncbi:MAG: hypothetical protein H0X31_22275 [Nostocaceae cyanobacterium]|nr:hypothetical protein [Nostocaceae cyanobacterium]
MDFTKTIDTQLTLPIELYLALSQNALPHGHSVNSEIVALLTPVLMQTSSELLQEFTDWETASDEDWISMEATLTSVNLVTTLIVTSQ